MARPDTLIGVAEPPVEVFHDPLGVADRLAVDDEDRHGALSRERVDLGAVGAAQRGADGLVLDAVVAHLARDAPAGAQPVARRAAAVERGHYGVSLPARASAW